MRFFVGTSEVAGNEGTSWIDVTHLESATVRREMLLPRGLKDLAKIKRSGIARGHQSCNPLLVQSSKGVAMVTAIIQPWLTTANWQSLPLFQKKKNSRCYSSTLAALGSSGCIQTHFLKRLRTFSGCGVRLSGVPGINSPIHK